MKMTVTKLLALKEKRQAAAEEFNKYDEQLQAKCPHPKSRVEVKELVFRDTLGNLCEPETHRFCTICDQYLD